MTSSIVNSLNRFPLPLSNVHVILVEPSRSSNVGSCARVMQNFGLDSLRIVSTRKKPHTKNFAAQVLATHKAHHILNGARVFPTVEEAVEDLNMVIGTTRRKRVVEPKHFDVSEIPERVLPLGSENNVGFMFGTEKSGLSNSSLALCDFTMSIPSQGSLNLSHAVLAVGYEIWKAKTNSFTLYDGDVTRTPNLDPPTVSTKKHFEKLLVEEIETLDNHKVNGDLALRIHQMITKADLTNSDINFMFSVFWAFKHKADASQKAAEKQSDEKTEAETQEGGTDESKTPFVEEVEEE
eukprot:TRINITY_DN9442_c0_g1_i1.p1 TRINITY_DN9442_c0_g1~~TRINITY_DN9442_c0_g1_i1.p1  ORF type:complete len:294 (-),score=72.86 TRINITY_DN9442_c0_g1_i1:144-1025(-)